MPSAIPDMKKVTHLRRVRPNEFADWFIGYVNSLTFTIHHGFEDAVRLKVMQTGHDDYQLRATGSVLLLPNGPVMATIAKTAEELKELDQHPFQFRLKSDEQELTLSALLLEFDAIRVGVNVSEVMLKLEEDAISSPIVGEIVREIDLRFPLLPNEANLDSVNNLTVNYFIGRDYIAGNVEKRDDYNIGGDLNQIHVADRSSNSNQSSEPDNYGTSATE